MATIKPKEITIIQSRGAFSILKKGFSSKEDYNFQDIALLRRVLSNEKARILHVLKTEKPESIYTLAKKLGRNFKTVTDDVKLLEKFGFLKLIEQKSKNRTRHKPELLADSITINLKI